MTKPEQRSLLQLDGLLGHLSCSSGLYAKETFLSLYSCVTRMIRDHRMHGLILTRTLGNEGFEAMAYALENLPGLPLLRFDGPDALPENTGITDQTGFLIVLSDRLCVTLHWSAQTDPTFQMYEGGWTFHPGDTKTMAVQLARHLRDEKLIAQVEATPVDRRYDDKLNVLITSLVNGLENRNRQLTVALEQVKTLNSRVVQNERLAAIGQLSSVIAHEIRNPLGLIDLYAKLVESQLEQLALDDEAQKDLLTRNLSQIRQATGSLETILSELTNYAKPLTLNTEVRDVVMLVKDICEFYQPKYAEKGVELIVPDVKEPLYADLDGDRIRQALINLIKNALEASDKGAAVTISVAGRQGDQAIYIKVSDEGKGISPDHARKLFTPYFSTKEAGTGLGLAHCRKILQAHGGNVELLSSTPGEGSIFALILPRQSDPAPVSKGTTAEIGSS